MKFLSLINLKKPGAFRKRPFLLLILLCALLVIMAGCGLSGIKLPGRSETEPVTKEIFAMDTYMTLTAYGPGAQEALDAAAQEIRRIDSMLSTGNESSEISQLNRTGSIEASEDTALLVRRSIDIYRDTGGVFDITIYPLMKAWGFSDKKYRIPEKEELSALLSTMGADQIKVEGSRITLGKEGMEIDLGGIAKGYTSGRVMEILKEYGIEHAVISLGGNVETLHDKPDGSAWRIAVEDPEKTGSYIGMIQVKDKAVITSGGYERYFEQGGQVYHHILDPSTGYPARSGLDSVTILSEDGTLADGLSTALFIMGKDRAASFWRDHKDLFDMVLVEEDGSVSVSEGIADAFSSDHNYEIIKP